MTRFDIILKFKYHDGTKYAEFKKIAIWKCAHLSFETLTWNILKYDLLVNFSVSYILTCINLQIEIKKKLGVKLQKKKRFEKLIFLN